MEDLFTCFEIPGDKFEENRVLHRPWVSWWATISDPRVSGMTITRQSMLSLRTLTSFVFYRYFHKVPQEAPALELKASYGLAEPITFELPPLSSQCTSEVYTTFDLTRGPKDDKV